MTVIRRYRGDTAPDQLTITRNGVVVNITACTFKLTVNSEKDPVDTTNQLFSVIGAITSAVNGEVEFSPNSTQADQAPGRYYYDVQMTDGTGAIRTVQKGVYRILQDITKA
jgi:hypothetical protein